MGWIKRNLFFVVGGVVTLALLGAGGFYIYKGWDRNSQASVNLNEIYDTLKNLQQQKPSPGNEKIDNARIAQEQQRQLREWIQSAGKFFQPIPAIPPDDISSETFKNALGRTVDTLQREAESAGVMLPPKYNFSFSAEQSLMKFAPGSLEPLAAQLGEVKAIAEMIFSARVNDLVGIQRVRASDDDAAGSPGDYIDDNSVTNDLAVITPYVVTFRCFTPELARVVSAFAASPSMVLVKAVNVQPAGAPAAAPGNVTAPPPAADKGGLQTVLKEQLLRVSLKLELVKLLPRNY